MCIAPKKENRKKRVKLNRKESIRKANEEDHEQNDISLSLKVLTTPQKSVLAKGQSLIPTQSDVNWLNVGKELNSFINQLLNFAKNTFPKGKEFEVAEIPSNQE